MVKIKKIPIKTFKRKGVTFNLPQETIIDSTVKTMKDAKWKLALSKKYNTQFWKEHKIRTLNDKLVITAKTRKDYWKRMKALQKGIRKQRGLN